MRDASAHWKVGDSVRFKEGEESRACFKDIADVAGVVLSVGDVTTHVIYPKGQTHNFYHWRLEKVEIEELITGVLEVGDLV